MEEWCFIERLSLKVGKLFYKYPTTRFFDYLVYGSFKEKIKWFKSLAFLIKWRNL